MSKKLIEQIEDTLEEKSDSGSVKAYDKLLVETRDAIIHLSVEHRKFMKGQGIDRGDKQYEKQVIDFASALEKGEFAITAMQKTIKKL